MIKAHWHKELNIGDTLTPIIVEYFTGQKVEWVNRNTRPKLLGIGSIMKALRVGDTVWGTGIMRETDTFERAKLCKILAVRGKLTEKILGINCGVYGDPAILLPLIYKPNIKKTRELGYVPHYIDQDLFVGKKIVDVRQNWKDFIDDLLQYERIETSSLHGFIIALAYGVPVKWVQYSNRVIGGGFKFRDFGTGVGLDIKENVWYNKIKNLSEIQNKLIKALTEYYND
jgi:pyruvyltransferase